MFNWRQNELLDYPMKTALPPSSQPRSKTSDGWQWNLIREKISSFLRDSRARYNVGIKFAIICLQAKKTVLAKTLHFLELSARGFGPAVVGCRLPKLTVSNGSRRLNTPITNRCQRSSMGKEPDAAWRSSVNMAARELACKQFALNAVKRVSWGRSLIETRALLLPY